MNLHKIERDYIALGNAIIDQDGEVTEDQELALQITNEALQTKGIAYSYMIKSLEYDNDTLDAEIKRLQLLKKSRCILADRLKSNLKDAMILFDISELKTATIKVNFRKSETVEVNEEIIDKKWCREKITYTPDKKAIKEAIEQGVEVVGASISYNQNLTIK